MSYLLNKVSFSCGEYSLPKGKAIVVKYNNKEGVLFLCKTNNGYFYTSCFGIWDCIHSIEQANQELFTDNKAIIIPTEHYNHYVKLGENRI